MRGMSNKHKEILEKLPKSIDKGSIRENRNEKFVTQTRKYKLITPLFGGGSEKKKADSVKIIRETEIRGQLRFWWRATRGVGTIEEMRNREGKLFGTAGKETIPSHIKIFVKDVVEGKEVDNARHIPSYASFPLEKGDKVREGVEFTLEISYPKLINIDKEKTIKVEEEIEASLWAWETFGGIGGRTRRGFGAIQLIDNSVQPRANTVKDYLLSKLKEYLSNGVWDKRVPHLSTDANNLAVSSISTSPNMDNANRVWKDLIEKLQNFRQSPRKPSERVFNGESNWSEPASIRNLLEAKISYRKTKSEIGNKFPRAQMGLPIIFKFKDGDVRNGDVKRPQTVKGKNHERLSSPLIVKPIACSGGAIGIGLALECPREPDGGVVLIGKGKVETKIRKDDIAHIAPMNHASLTETDVVKSFLRFLEK